MNTGYQGATFVLLTQHGKEQVFAPQLHGAFAARVEVVGGFDTDTLGTFTRTIRRVGSQLEAVQKKARLAVERSGRPLGLGSEGAFTPGPLGWGSVNHELVCLVDAERGIEIVGRASAAGHHHHALLTSQAALEAWARDAGFPEHAAVVRPESEDHVGVRNGLVAWPELLAAFAEARAASSTGAVFVETDLRAHLHPSRRATIAAAVGDLVERMRARCPVCEAPGFGLRDRVPGLPCIDCGAATHITRAEAFGCVACAHEEVRALSAQRAADPSQCNACNP